MKHPFRTALAFLAVISSPALAADTTWTSAVGTQWANNALWSSGQPTASQGAIFVDNSSNQHSVDIAGNTVTTLGIQFNAGTGSSGFDLIETGAGGGMNLRAGGTANGIINNDSVTHTIETSISLFSVNGFTVGFNQQWNAASGSLVFTGTNSTTLSTLNLNSGTLTIMGSKNVTIGTVGRGDIVGAGSLVMNGGGTLTLGGTMANTYSGPTYINSGTLTTAKPNAIAGNVVGNGGKLNADYFNQSMGTLALSNSFTIDFNGGNGAHIVLPPGSNTVAFASSAALNWNGQILNILDWNPNETLKFGSSSSALTAQQLTEIQFPDIPGITQATISASGVVTPIPEPSTAVLSIIGGGVLAYGFVARRRKA